MGAVNPLARQYLEYTALFDAQPVMVQRFLEGQARPLAEAIVQRAAQIRFRLPPAVVTEIPAGGGAGQPSPIAQGQQNQAVGSMLSGLSRADSRKLLRDRLAQMEGSADRAVAVGAGLLRYATAYYMVHQMLPSGRTVVYHAPEDEDIPCLPAEHTEGPESALTAQTDAIVEEGGADRARGELPVPYVPYARRFYLPQWVALDDSGHLLVNTAQEAEAHLASMQRFIGVLHSAVGLAGYMVEDDEYQRKRYGILGQLVNQGRALAMHQTRAIIARIQQRAAANSLNRGLSVSLPYFDDQDLAMRTYHFVIIPAGRIMFVPGLVVRAAREEYARVAQDTRMSPSTRKYLLLELEMLRQAFGSTGSLN